MQGLTAAEAIDKSFDYGATGHARHGDRQRRPARHLAARSLQPDRPARRRCSARSAVTNPSCRDWSPTSTPSPGRSPRSRRTCRGRSRLLGPTLQIAEPSLRHTNATLPFLRRFALDLTPGIRELPATIAASQPWLDQTAALLQPSELGFVAHQLRLAAPGSAKAVARRPRPVLPDRPDQRLRGQRPSARERRRPQRLRHGLQLHDRRAELQGVRLRGGRPRRRERLLRRQRALSPLLSPRVARCPPVARCRT